MLKAILAAVLGGGVTVLLQFFIAAHTQNTLLAVAFVLLIPTLP